MRALLLPLAVILTIFFAAGCPECTWPGDPNAPLDPNSPVGNGNEGNANGSAGNENVNSAPDPAALGGEFLGEFTGTYEVLLDGAAQPPLALNIGFSVELDAGRLVSLKPYGPSVWRFGWAPAAEVTNVGDVVTTGMTTITSSLNERITLTEYSIDEERIRFTIEMSFTSYFYSVVQARIGGTSVQTFELFPDAGGLRAVTWGSFDYVHTPGIPSNEGPAVHYVEEFSGDGVLRRVE